MIIKVHALMRSGHHAVMDGIYQSMSNDKMFINNCRNGDSYHWYSLNGDGRYTKDVKKHLTNRSVIMNFEHKNLNTDLQWINDWGGVKSDFNVLILRDPYNWLSSSMNFKDRVPLDMNLWKQQAKEFLGITNNLDNKITITYNSWVTDIDYMKEKLGEINLQLKNDYDVESFVGLSSFSKTKNYFSRWEKYKDNKNYLSRFDDEVHDLSEQIFNFNPLTNE